MSSIEETLSSGVKVQYVSDLHLEFSDCAIPILPDTDILVLAGDIHSNLTSGAQFVKNLSTLTPPRPTGQPLHIVLILGNHECYKHTYPETVAQMRQLYQDIMTNVHFLENDSVTLLGVKFVGAALWCDPPVESHFLIQHSIADFVRIQDWTLTSCQAQCRESVAYIESQLQNYDGPTVVVTHFCPSLHSIHERYQKRPQDRMINRYFATPLDDLIAHNSPVAWIHGHTHSSMDYTLKTQGKDNSGVCRVLCNPRGYSNDNNKHPENSEFDTSKHVYIEILKNKF